MAGRYGREGTQSPEPTPPPPLPPLSPEKGRGWKHTSTPLPGLSPGGEARQPSLREPRNSLHCGCRLVPGGDLSHSVTAVRAQCQPIHTASCLTAPHPSRALLSSKTSDTTQRRSSAQEEGSKPALGYQAHGDSGAKTFFLMSSSGDTGVPAALSTSNSWMLLTSDLCLSSMCPTIHGTQATLPRQASRPHEQAQTPFPVISPSASFSAHPTTNLTHHSPPFPWHAHTHPCWVPVDIPPRPRPQIDTPPRLPHSFQGRPKFRASSHATLITSSLP